MDSCPPLGVHCHREWCYTYYNISFLLFILKVSIELFNQSRGIFPLRTESLFVRMFRPTFWCSIARLRTLFKYLSLSHISINSTTSLGGPITLRRLTSKGTFTMSKAAERSRLAISTYLLSSGALVMRDCNVRPAVEVLRFLQKPCCCLQAMLISCRISIFQYLIT